jgi:hypothetical protein
VGAEIDDQGGSLIDTGDRAKTVLVVGDLVAYREALGRRLRVGRAERTGGQVTPGTGGVMAHCHQYAPNSGAGPQGSYAWARFRGRIRACGGCVSSRFRAGRPEHHRQEDRDQHLPLRLPEHGECSPAGGQQHQVQADLEAVVDRPPPEQARPLHSPRHLRVVASGTGGGQRSRRACTGTRPIQQSLRSTCPPGRASAC